MRLSGGGIGVAPHDGPALHTGIPLPARLLANVAAWNPAEIAPGWLADVPATVAALCARERITLDPAIPETEITLVLLGSSHSLGPVVIKGSPLTEEFRAEATALRLATGDGVARLYHVDTAHNLMLLERIVPGTQLREVAMSDEAATRLAAESAAAFWKPVPDPAGLLPLRGWMRALLDESRSPDPVRVPGELLVLARKRANAFLAGSRTTRLLHGDLQHHNLLRRASGAWAIIDPKGLAGDPGFEIAAWMYNPPGVTLRDDYLALAERRLAIAAEVWGIAADELAAWAFVGMVLSACWSASGPTPAGHLAATVRGAETLRSLLH